MNELQIEAFADDVFAQIAQGYEVQLTPEQAEALGCFEETALTVEDVEDDAALRLEMTGGDDE